MRVLFVLENYHPHVGGVETVFRNLAEGLASKGHRVDVITHHLAGTKRYEKVNGVDIHRIGSNRYSFTFLCLPLAILYAHEADIVHTTTFNAAPPAWLAAKLSGKKVVLTVHEVWIGMWKKLSELSAMSKMLHDVSERFIHIIPYDALAAVSHSTRRQLIRIGINPKKITVVYNGLDYRHFDPKKYKDNIRTKLGLGKKFVYLTYGRPGLSKGIEYVVGAARIIANGKPDSVLLLMLSRDPAYREQYRMIMNKIQEQGGEENVKIIPPVSYKELPHYLKVADCIVVPSLAEGFGYTAAEACAMDIPVVASNVTSLPEVVSGKHILVRPKSSHAIATAVLKIRSGKYDRTKRKKFTIEKNIEGYLALYLKLIKKDI